MDEILEKLETWRNQGNDVAVATVVKTSGSTPRHEGAKLLVRGDGELAGSVSGGCVETDVALHAQEVLEAGKPRLVNYGISDEMGISVGLACGGSIEVLIEPTRPVPDEEGDLSAIANLVQHEVPVAIGTVLRPAENLSRRAWLARGELHGSLGDATLEAAFLDHAARLLRSGQSKAVSATSGG